MVTGFFYFGSDNKEDLCIIKNDTALKGKLNNIEDKKDKISYNFRLLKL